MRIPRITIDMMVAVVALAQKRTMELAAKELGLTPSAVHKRIQAVNGLFGRPLFTKAENGMALTEAGRRFYLDAAKALEEVLLAEDKALSLVELEAGHLLVGHSTYLPPRVLTALVSYRFDDAFGVHIEHIPLLTSTAVQRVANGTIHIGFGYGGAAKATCGQRRFHHHKREFPRCQMVSARKDVGRSLNRIQIQTASYDHCGSG